MTLPVPRFDFRVRRLPGAVTQGPEGRMEFPGVEITAHPRRGLLADLGHRLNAAPGPMRAPRTSTVNVVPAPLDQRISSGRFHFTVRELPGPVRIQPGGRMDFPGVEITAHPAPNLSRDIARGMEEPARSTGSRFDWTVRQLAGAVRPGPRGRMEFPGVEITATPRTGLLHELGQHLLATSAEARYDFQVRQLPGPVTPRPGGGLQFPPIEVTAIPARSSGNLLHDLGRRLDQTR